VKDLFYLKGNSMELQNVISGMIEEQKSQPLERGINLNFSSF